MTRPTPTVAIVGAGFSGTIVAANLLQSTTHPLRILLIDRTGRIGRGVAYGTTSSSHVLNVPAGRMSAFPGDEEHFLRFARWRDANVIGGSFVQRKVFGDYLEASLRDAESRASGAGGVLERVHGEVRDIEPAATGHAATLTFADGRTVHVDRVVLAAGNYAPSDPYAGQTNGFYATARYVRDPWAPGALQHVPSDAPVLLLGTGLTMLDMAIELEGRGRSAPMYAVSRRGLVPQPHRPHGAPPSYGHLPPELIACEASAVSYLRAIRRHARRLAADGIDWREVVASLRPVTPRLWETLSVVERKRFLRHARPFWDAHRHRVAPELYDAFDAMRQRGALELSAGRVLDYNETESSVTVRVWPRGASAPRALSVGMVINCTGPASDVRELHDPLLDALMARGLVRSDPLGLGLDVRDDGRLVARDGDSGEALWLVSPFLKGSYWEATAVPELRVHAARTARRLLASLSTA